MKKTVTKQPEPKPEVIEGYQLTRPWTTKGAGTSMWSFAQKDGKAYFIKRFLSPVWPEENGGISPGAREHCIKRCKRFEEEKKRVYAAVSASANGNIVVIEDFFRSGTKYHLTTELITGEESDPKQIAALPDAKKLVFLRVIAQSISLLHKNKVVHGDLKPENILVRRNAHGNYVPKLIDFGESFFEDGINFGLTGDVYLSPEAAMSMEGEEVAVTCKADVFALGLMFHEYWTGKLPAYDRSHSYAAYALLNKGTIQVDHDKLREYTGLEALLGSMLMLDPEKRPTMQEVFGILTGNHRSTAVDNSASTSLKINGLFHAPEDL